MDSPKKQAPRLTLTTASGNQVVSLWSRAVRFTTAKDQAFVVNFRVADVTRPILSAMALANKGWESVLGDGYGYIQFKGGEGMHGKAGVVLPRWRRTWCIMVAP